MPKTEMHQALPQWLRFIAVGVLNTSFSYGVYAVLLWLGLNFVAANFGAVLLGIIFSFRTQGTYVFGSSRWGRLRRFVPVWGVIFLLNICVIALLLRFGLNAYVAGAVALVPITLLSYLLQKFFVFADPPSPDPASEPPASRGQVQP